MDETGVRTSTKSYFTLIPEMKKGLNHPCAKCQWDYRINTTVQLTAVLEMGRYVPVYHTGTSLGS
jgi:hypothetical protein